MNAIRQKMRPFALNFRLPVVNNSASNYRKNWPMWNRRTRMRYDQQTPPVCVAVWLVLHLKNSLFTWFIFFLRSFFRRIHATSTCNFPVQSEVIDGILKIIRSKNFLLFSGTFTSRSLVRFWKVWVINGFVREFPQMAFISWFINRSF